MRNPFVFLLGCPRSGTSLLKRMVDAHPRIAIVPGIRWLARTFADRENLTPDGRTTPDFIKSLKRLGMFSSVPLSEEELASFQEPGRAMPYADFMTVIFDRYGQRKGKKLVGDKNSDHAVAVDVPTLHALWPDAKFIHLIRDGRDVCLSVLDWRVKDKLSELFPRWDDSPVINVALWWEWQVRAAREGGAPLGPSRYREIRYENIVARPDQACAELCEFMDVPYDGAMLRFHEGKDPEGTAKKAWMPPTPGLRSWKSQMPPEQQEQFEGAAGDLLDELGYERGAARMDRDASRQAAALREAFALRPLPRGWRPKAK